MNARSRRPYLIRAIYDWATANGYTPHVLVAADYPGVQVPTQYVQDGRITLNISPTAVQNFDVLPELLWFSARFAGRAYEIQVPVGAVLAVFARENGEGVVFGEVEPLDGTPETGPVTAQDHGPSPDPDDRPRPSGRPHLRRVK
jgi:stringent starvation protein B